MTLSAKGFKLRESIAEAGIELTPDELDEGLLEAHQRIRGGPCSVCGRDLETRFGICFLCFNEKGGCCNG
ncbi:hypothetical protein KAR91_20915 [Candidatus Pacearchaeota archaeon]|nr:hypothetical protein [Candidatus Pacearchaeota archaeon]